MPNPHLMLPPGQWRGPGPDGTLDLQVVETGRARGGWIPVAGWAYGPDDNDKVFARDLWVAAGALRQR